MRVVISAGGTGGHIYPAIAIINKIRLQEPNSEFLYIGTHNRMEKDIIPALNIPYEAIKVYGFNRRYMLRNIKNIFLLIKGYRRSRKLIKRFNPDVVIGVAGYVTVPVILAASRLKYKTFIHEQNSVPGKANKFLSKYATKIGISFKSTISFFPASKTIFTGNPCSEEAINKPAMTKEELGLSVNKRLVYIVMGSLGATKISNILIETLPLFEPKSYEVIFVTGKDSYEDVIKNPFPSNVKIFPYIDNQTRVMKLADVMVSRCGASTLSEIIALEIPSILIPSPYVPDNHQYKNAMDLITENAAVLIEEKDLSNIILVKIIDDLIGNTEKIKEMKAKLNKMSIPNSASKIYEILSSLVEWK